MGLFKAFGRWLGEKAEELGEATGIEWIRKGGRKLQDICQETGRRTGSTREYDKDTATIDETAHIAEILSSFSSGLHGQGEILEQTAKKHVEDYFDQLYTEYTAMSAVFAKKNSIKSLMLQKQVVLGSISGSFNEILTRRVSLSDTECLAILKLPKGAAKEKKMNAFGAKVINEGLEKLCDNVKKSVEVIREETESELNDMVEEQRRLLEEISKQIQEVTEKRKNDVDSTESSILFPAQKLVASELLLNLVQGEKAV